jgi:di/tricarboxylate transporter
MNLNTALFIFLLLILSLLISGKFRASLIFSLSLIPFFILGTISEDNIIDAFFNTSVLTIFALIILSNIIYKEFLFFQFIEQWLVRFKSKSFFIFFLHSITISISAFINNTPVVSSFIPILRNLNKKTNFTNSYTLITLNHAALLGGTLTLIGTSTHLVINGLLHSKGHELLNSIQFFKAAWPAAMVGGVYLFIIQYFNKSAIRKTNVDEISKNPLFTFDLKVRPQSSLAGKTIEQAKLRNLENFYLFQIIRNNQFIEATPNVLIENNDRLFFTGNTTQIEKLLQLFPDLEYAEKLSENRIESIVEAVILNDSYLHNKSLKTIQFRENFGAIVLGLSKNNQEINSKLGTTQLHSGDILLMKLNDQAKFKEMYPGNLLIVANQKLAKEKKKPFKSLFIALLVTITFLCFYQKMAIFSGLLILIFAAIIFRFTNQFELKKFINLDLWLMIGSSIALSEAILNTFDFNALQQDILPLVQHFPMQTILFIVLFSTALLTNFLSNLATVSILFPFVSVLSNMYPTIAEALFLALALGASASFFTHYGYQTNSMIFYSGNYTSKDFFKAGFPLWIIYLIITFISLSHLYV